jgi:hypothetical protein
VVPSRPVGTQDDDQSSTKDGGSAAERRSDAGLLRMIAVIVFVPGAVLVLDDVFQGWGDWLKLHWRGAFGSMLIAGSFVILAAAVQRQTADSPGGALLKLDAKGDRTKEALKWLEASLKKEIAHFHSESEKHKRIDRASRTAAIVLSALTTVVAAVGLHWHENQETIQFVVLCSTTLMAAVTGWTEMRRARDLWVHERDIHNALKDIQRAMVRTAATKKEVTLEDVNELFMRIDEVLVSSSRRWGAIVDSKPPPTARGSNEAAPKPPG